MYVAGLGGGGGGGGNASSLPFSPSNISLHIYISCHRPMHLSSINLLIIIIIIILDDSIHS